MKNNKEEQLFAKMIIFFFVIILIFGLIIINEKKDTLKTKKIDEKLNNYIQNNYKNIKNEIKVIPYNTYSKKIVNKNNKNLYFTVTYKNKKITSTYQKDYIEGKTLIKYLEKELNKDFKNKNKDNNYSSVKISLDLKLNNCTKPIKNRLINNKYNTPLYTINYRQTITLNNYNIDKQIINLNNYITKLGFNPKYYVIIFTDTSDITNSLKIKFKANILNIKNLSIGNIVMNNNKELMDKYNISIQYLN